MKDKTIKRKRPIIEAAIIPFSNKLGREVRQIKSVQEASVHENAFVEDRSGDLFDNEHSIGELLPLKQRMHMI